MEATVVDVAVSPTDLVGDGFSCLLSACVVSNVVELAGDCSLSVG